MNKEKVLIIHSNSAADFSSANVLARRLRQSRDVCVFGSHQKRWTRTLNRCINRENYNVVILINHQTNNFSEKALGSIESLETLILVSATDNPPNNLIEDPGNALSMYYKDKVVVSVNYNPVDVVYGMRVLENGKVKHIPVEVGKNVQGAVRFLIDFIDKANGPLHPIEEELLDVYDTSSVDITDESVRLKYLRNFMLREQMDVMLDAASTMPCMVYSDIAMNYTIHRYLNNLHEALINKKDITAGLTISYDDIEYVCFNYLEDYVAGVNRFSKSPSDIKGVTRSDLRKYISTIKEFHRNQKLTLKTALIIISAVLSKYIVDTYEPNNKYSRIDDTALIISNNGNQTIDSISYIVDVLNVCELYIHPSESGRLGLYVHRNYSTDLSKIMKALGGYYSDGEIIFQDLYINGKPVLNSSISALKMELIDVLVIEQNECNKISA